MAVWTRDFRVSTITLDIDDGDGDGPLTPIRGLISATSSANTEVESEQSAASTLADNATLKRIRPTIQFTTHDLKAAIDAFGLFGKCIVADANDEGLAFYGQKQGCTGPESGSVHDKYLLQNALVVPNSLSVSHQGNVALTYDVYTRYDGTNAPVVFTQNNALPTITLGPVGRWGMYQMTVGTSSAADVTGKRDIRLDFGASVTQEGADSEIQDSVVSLSSLLPVLSVRGVDTSWFSTVAPLAGAATSWTYTKLILKRRDKGLSDATNLTMSFNGLLTPDQIFNLTVGAPGESSFKLN